jgi:5-methyltetrahydrofolate--homocysteine methyltransferase
MIIIGEKINGTRQEVGAAIGNRDSRLIKHLAKEQIEAGADYLDLNAGTHPAQEPADLAWLVTTVQEEIPEVKLCLDSANPQALLAGIEIARRLPMINSLSGEKDRVAGVLPLACKYKTELVILALDDEGIPETWEKRLEIVRRLVDMTQEGGLKEDMLYIDPLVATIATDNQSGRTALEAIRQIRIEFPHAHVTCGLSNISFGQPARSIINQAFAALAIGAGMDSAILDPCEKGLRSSIYSAELVAGQDPDCLRYNRAYRSGLIGPTASSAPANNAAVAATFWELSEALTQAGIIRPGLKPTEALPDHTVAAKAAVEKKSAALEELADALVGMQKARVTELAKVHLESGTDPMEILEVSKGAMSEVGRLFETQEYFIPELILAGAMLKNISELVQPYLQGKESETQKRGRVIIGTVQGDIHDIGKDIVVTMLEANGYDVMDLGVDVPPSRFVAAAKEFKPQVIGLSGFLTLVYDPMKKTIAALRAENVGEVKFMIGGGQIDDQVMHYTEADGWGTDAIAAVNFCNQWIA